MSHCRFAGCDFPGRNIKDFEDINKHYVSHYKQCIVCVSPLINIKSLTSHCTTKNHNIIKETHFFFILPTNQIIIKTVNIDKFKERIDKILEKEIGLSYYQASKEKIERQSKSTKAIPVVSQPNEIVFPNDEDEEWCFEDNSEVEGDISNNNL
ncbi:hypothetical protein PPL_08542 [Heterostelium album PN500]|uniref:Uncharacterized protein n=1 Tax=Heterostelium pallidum (strain ATCC 26659 / Pp 5 / PN500) TaxID=670386 RepID=D3BJ23_HETP5|nr:hypothetical protein PPL_08542 [Heterostelium album PN500]EFA77903.1 hypothetical protein PPL_08542 [Heterostelium album PN500]|eukprot:XP_020430031.1 hypothetical protein PPL_08542 [Heterostelium album PN500]